MNRRTFLQTGLIGGASALVPALAFGAAGARRVALVADLSDPIAASVPAQWALGELERALTAAGVAVVRLPRAQDAAADDVCVVAAGHSSPALQSALTRERVSIGDGPERLAIFPARLSGRGVTVACGTDPRGVSYALTDLADRVRYGADPIGALAQSAPLVEHPANAVRSVMRQFTSAELDTPWLHDREMWPAYLTMLAAARFNRLHLAFGLGYDALQQVADSYCLFLYPFLVDVPGYGVRVTNLSEAERARNLDSLRFISEQTVARGMEFQLGVWMHGYALANSPRARHIVEGLGPETHAAYCRDALAAVLRACPAISAVALRIHGESGIKEGSYEFWQTVFDGVVRSGRRVEIDLHAKGLDQPMIERALATGMPVNVSPKYWAEHLGMPYHQAAIRDLEMPIAGQTGRGLMTLSEGSLSFTRYGYADFLRDDRKYTVRHRVFAGTQRLLLAADPAATSAHSRMFRFCGSTGVDVMEPLTCRGRRGTGIEGTRRSGYADERLDTRWDWEKFSVWYRVWGRLTYDADSGGAPALRPLGADPRGRALSAALAGASRILPTVTTAHLPSAACDAYWPEVYWNQPIVGEPRPNFYGDTPAPKVFAHVSPLDPELFSSIAQHADELLADVSGAKYSPIEVAAWLEALAANVDRDLTAAGRLTAPGDRRLAVDARIQAGLGRFFAAKFRAGVLYAIHERTGDRPAIDAACASYRRARAAWAALAEEARGVYCGRFIRERQTVGPRSVDRSARGYRRGHHADGCARRRDGGRRRRPSRSRGGGTRARHGREVARAVHAHAARRFHARRRGASGGADRRRRSGRGPVSLPSREPGGALPDRPDGTGRRRPSRQHPRRLHGFAIPSSVLFHPLGEAVTGDDASGIGLGQDEPAVFRAPPAAEPATASAPEEYGAAASSPTRPPYLPAIFARASNTRRFRIDHGGASAMLSVCVIRTNWARAGAKAIVRVRPGSLRLPPPACSTSCRPSTPAPSSCADSRRPAAEAGAPGAAPRRAPRPPRRPPAVARIELQLGHQRRLRQFHLEPHARHLRNTGGPAAKRGGPGRRRRRHDSRSASTAANRAGAAARLRARTRSMASSGPRSPRARARRRRASPGRRCCRNWCGRTTRSRRPTRRCCPSAP